MRKEFFRSLLERITFPTQPIHLRKNLPTVVEDAEQNLSSRLRRLLDRLWQEWKQTEIDIQTITDEIERISNQDERCRRLRQIPGFRILGDRRQTHWRQRARHFWEFRRKYPDTPRSFRAPGGRFAALMMVITPTLLFAWAMIYSDVGMRKWD